MAEDISSSSKFINGGRGTEQALDVARQLRGKFRRFHHNHIGTVCELAWSITTPKSWQLKIFSNWSFSSFIGS